MNHPDRGPIHEAANLAIITILLLFPTPVGERSTKVPVEKRKPDIWFYGTNSDSVIMPLSALGPTNK